MEDQTRNHKTLPEKARRRVQDTSDFAYKGPCQGHLSARQILVVWRAYSTCDHGGWTLRNDQQVVRATHQGRRKVFVDDFGGLSRLKRNEHAGTRTAIDVGKCRHDQEREHQLALWSHHKSVSSKRNSVKRFSCGWTCLVQKCQTRQHVMLWQVDL